MTNVVIVVSLVIAGCSLAVSMTAGVNDRKRPFSLLRLTSVSLVASRRVVALEAAVPLLVVSLLSAGIGSWPPPCSSDPSWAKRSDLRDSTTTSSSWQGSSLPSRSSPAPFP
jgi:hypothetical protein